MNMSNRVYKWVPVVDQEYCNGCGICVNYCTPECLEIIEDKAVLTTSDQCGSEGHCIEPCPEKAINMNWVEITGNNRVGEWLELVTPYGFSIYKNPPAH
jgi:MinD superfamily P-loop ATPase